MTPNEYLASLLQKYAVNVESAKIAVNAIYPTIQNWGNGYLENATFSGSMAKGTSISLSTDADVFLSLASNTPGTLADMYNSLCIAMEAAGLPVRRQNVSVGTTKNGCSIDLVPGRRQSQQGADHSLYRRKANSWTLTNVDRHIAYVRDSGRVDEIRILKIWRTRYSLDFPSFFLEMATIEALSGRRRGDVGSNVLFALEFIRDRISNVRLVDPSNANNIISDDLSDAEKRTLSHAASRAKSESNWGGIVW